MHLTDLDCSYSYVLFPCCSGLEHHIPQLADLCAAAVGLSHLDPACQVLFTPVAVTEQIRNLINNQIIFKCAVLIDAL